MTKEVQMTFRVESALRFDFMAAAEQAHRPAAQVLRELMRAYVKEMLLPVNLPQQPSTSVDERRQREHAVKFARASLGLEGLHPSADQEEQAQRFIEGDIALAEFVGNGPVHSSDAGMSR